MLYDHKMAPIHPELILAINGWIDVQTATFALAEVVKNFREGMRQLDVRRSPSQQPHQHLVAGLRLVQLGGNMYPVTRTRSHAKTRAFPAPNWRGNCGTQY